MMKELVYDYFETYIDKQVIDERLKKAMCYSLISNGKLIRPLVFFTFLKEFNIEAEKYVNIACAIEMIHTYSLVHDDLPAMDDDEYRRGRLTTHKVYGEDLAILAGDGLLTHAFDVIIDNENLTANQKVLLVKNLVDCCGVNEGMINGQVLDIKNVDITLDETQLQQIHYQKTSRMLQLPVICSLIVSNKLELKEALNELMSTLGLLFQVRDDYLDYYGSSEIGKDNKSDFNNNKYTYVNVYEDEESLLAYISKLKQTAHEIIESNNLGSEIKRLVEMFGDRNK